MCANALQPCALKKFRQIAWLTHTKARDFQRIGRIWITFTIIVIPKKQSKKYLRKNVGWHVNFSKKKLPKWLKTWGLKDLWDCLKDLLTSWAKSVSKWRHCITLFRPPSVHTFLSQIFSESYWFVIYFAFSKLKTAYLAVFSLILINVKYGKINVFSISFFKMYLRRVIF